jgi:hypothetical protein
MPVLCVVRLPERGCVHLLQSVNRMAEWLNGFERAAMIVVFVDSKAKQFGWVPVIPVLQRNQ